MSYRIDVRVGNEVVPNAMRFQTKEQAREYGDLLLIRWTAARSYFIEPCPCDRCGYVNCRCSAVSDEAILREQADEDTKHFADEEFEASIQ